MNLTEEYINECDCPEIQGLRKELKLYDFYTFEYGDDLYPTISICVDETLKYKGFIWLPTGDQLTDLIFKHCHTYNLDITLYHEHHCKDCGKYCIAVEANNANGHLIEKEIDIEAREYEIKLAKIKLLKELLKESEE